MKITYWSDYACPYCYIGEARLKKAVAKLALSDVTYERKAFELDPTAPKEVVSSTTERFAKKYGLSEAGARAQIEHISSLGRGEGIAFNYATTRYTNTLDAHRLTKFAEEKNQAIAEKIETALFDSYFTKNEKLSDRAVLLRIAQDAGLDRDETAAFLDSDRLTDEVRLDEREAARYGIHGVPYFVIDGILAIPGAMDTGSFVDALQQAMEEGKKRQTESEKSAEDRAAFSCGPDGCRIR